MIKNTELIILIAKYLGKVIQVKSLSWNQNNISVEVGILQSLVHDIHLSLGNALLLKHDCITDSLHAILYQKLEIVTILACIKVLCGNLGHHILDIEHLIELF